MGIDWPLGRTSRAHGWKLRVFLCAAALCVLLTGATSAQAAKNICVGVDLTSACPIGSTTATDLADAVTKATDPTRNNVYLASDDTTTGLDFLAAPVKLIGVGASKPVVTMTGIVPGTAAITMSALTTEVNNIEIDLPASTGQIGINAPWGGQKITNVTINGASATSATGIALSGSSPQVNRAQIDLSASGTGVSVAGSNSAILDDVAVSHAGTAVQLVSSFDTKIRRMVAHAKNGVVATDSDGTVSSSVIAPSAVGIENVNGVGVSASALTIPHTIRVDNCTLIGSGSNPTGIVASSGVTGTQNIDVNSSVIKGYTAATSTSGPGAEAIALVYSFYSSALGSNSTADANSQLFTGDYGFTGADDFRPTLSSPLVDAGDPAALDSTDSATDVLDAPRVVSRGAGNIRDIGAYEVQNSTPVPNIKVLTAVPSTTAATEFSAAGSTDAEGDAMTYNWTFDGSPAASGPTAKKLFAAEGPHTVQLTVADKTGASATISEQFNVARGFLPLTLRSQNARLSTKGTFKITMTCPAEAVSNCNGRLLFQTAKKVDAKNYTQRPGWAAKTSYLQAARYVFSIPPGATRKLEVRTYSTFQNVLWKHKKFAIVGSLVSGSTSNASLTANRANFTISAPKSRR